MGFVRIHGKSILIDGDPWNLNAGTHLTGTLLAILSDVKSLRFFLLTLRTSLTLSCFSFGEIDPVLSLDLWLKVEITEVRAGLGVPGDATAIESLEYQR